jgi:hypothetical protein
MLGWSLAFGQKADIFQYIRPNEWLPGQHQSNEFAQTFLLADFRRTNPKSAKSSRKPPKTPRSESALLKTQAVELVRRMGVATTKDFAAIGISRHYLCKLCAEGVLSRVGYSRYGLPAAAA